MCGILGTLAQREAAPATRNVLQRMGRAIAHRGPDDEGFHFDGPVALGHRRLSIIDLAGGHQPLFNEDGSLAIVFNGEIYNFGELTTELLERGHAFQTRSDTEAIVHAFEEWGPAALARLRGMFAFALWDRKAGSLLLARDRLGIKPLYYTFADGQFLFSSEIKALLEHPGVHRRMSRAALEDYLTFRYVPGPDTMFEGIFKLQPGHWMRVDRTGHEIRPYWEVSYEPQYGSEDDLAEELLVRLEEAVRLRLISDVPLGAFLSGGLDSSTIVALMSRMASGPVKTFSVGFDAANGAFSELGHARAVARQFGTDHHEIVVGYREMKDNLERIVWHFDEPVSDPAAIPTLLVSELASRQVKVVLTGEGSDEIFAGYPKYAVDRYHRSVALVPPFLRDSAVSLAGLVNPGLADKLRRFGKVLAIGDDAERWTQWFGLFDQREKAALLGGKVLYPDAPASRYRALLSRVHGRDPLNAMLYIDTKTWLVDDLLMKGDKMTMAASIEGRVPFLDHKLVEWAATLPVEYKVSGRRTKALLKRAVSRFLPSSITERRKVGFTVPLQMWFRQEMKDYLREVLLAEEANRGVFDQGIVAKMLEAHLSGREDRHRELWALLNFELWCKRYLAPRERFEAG